MSRVLLSRFIQAPLSRITVAASPPDPPRGGDADEEGR
jgi:hypothetical protein